MRNAVELRPQCQRLSLEHSTTSMKTERRRLVELRKRRVHAEVEPTQSWRSSTKRTQRSSSSSSAPHVEIACGDSVLEIKLVDLHVEEIVWGSALSTIWIDDDNVRLLCRASFNQWWRASLAGDSKVEGYLQEMFDTMSCRHSRNPLIEPVRKTWRSRTRRTLTSPSFGPTSSWSGPTTSSTGPPWEGPTTHLPTIIFIGPHSLIDLGWWQEDFILNNTSRGVFVCSVRLSGFDLLLLLNVCPNSRSWLGSTRSLGHKKFRISWPRCYCDASIRRLCFHANILWWVGGSGVVWGGVVFLHDMHGKVTVLNN